MKIICAVCGTETNNEKIICNFCWNNKFKNNGNYEEYNGMYKK